MVSFPIPSSQTLYLMKPPSSCLTEDHFWGWKFLEYSYWSYLFSKTLNRCCHWLYTYTCTRVHTHRPHSTLGTKEISCLRRGFSCWGSSDGSRMAESSECVQSSCQAVWKMILLLETYKAFQCREESSISKLHFHYRHKGDDSQKWVFGTDGCIYSKVRTMSTALFLIFSFFRFL